MIFTISSVTLNAAESEYVTPNVITQASSVEEDMVLLGIDLSEIEAGTDKDDRILTFGNLYYEQSGNIFSEIVMYYYSPNFKLSYDYLYVDLEATYLENYGISSNVDNWPTGISCWKIIKISELGIYKLKYDSECYTGNNPITELIKIFDKVQFTTHAIGTSVARVSNATETTFNSSAFVVVKNQHFQLLNEFSSEDYIRSFSSVGYDEEYITVDGLCIGYTFDVNDTIWDNFTLTDNQLDLFFMFFNVETNGVKWTNTKQITKVDLTYREAKMVDHYVNFELNSTSIGDITSLEQVVTNDAYTFTYPAASNSFSSWFTNKYTMHNIEYKGIWTLDDDEWNNVLSQSSNYNPEDFSDYTFALQFGNKNGYDRIRTTTSGSQDYTSITHDESRTLAVVTDVAQIEYIEDGIAYCVQVDETNVEFGGYLNGDDAPVVETPVEEDSWWLKLWNMFLDWINSLLNKPAVKTIVIILICVAAVVLLFSIWSKVATIQALRKKK